MKTKTIIKGKGRVIVVETTDHDLEEYLTSNGYQKTRFGQWLKKTKTYSELEREMNDIENACIELGINYANRHDLFKTLEVLV